MEQLWIVFGLATAIGTIVGILSRSVTWPKSNVSDAFGGSLMGAGTGAMAGFLLSAPLDRLGGTILVAAAIAALASVMAIGVMIGFSKKTEEMKQPQHVPGVRLAHMLERKGLVPEIVCPYCNARILSGTFKIVAPTRPPNWYDLTRPATACPHCAGVVSAGSRNRISAGIFILSGFGVLFVHMLAPMFAPDNSLLDSKFVVFPTAAILVAIGGLLYRRGYYLEKEQ